MLSESFKNKILIYFGAAFIVANAIFIYFEHYWFMLLPVALIIGALAIFRLDILLLFIVFCTPLAINLEHLDFGLGMSLPTEPLMFGAMILFFFKVLYEKKFDRRVFWHPISIAILLHLLWIGFTTITSQMPFVSFKFFLARMWFVCVCYFLATQLFAADFQNIKRFFWLYIIPLLIVIIYAVTWHSTYRFAEKPAHWVMTPFYKDHTSYGAILAMYFPIIFLFLNKRQNNSIRFFTSIVLIIFTIGIILSYTRAAWLSLIGALGLYFVYYFKIKFRTLLLVGATLVGLFLFFQSDIIMYLEKNKQDSSDNLAEHVKSISNIKSDASNLERINRWQSALRMFKERPIFGFGPGTYMFQYASYQMSYETTIISTNMGDMGNAHSEYIGPLAEQGLLGTLFFIGILVTVFLTATRLYNTLQNKEMKQIVILITLGLATYFVHGLLNNFLDTDKASVPFWGFIAILTAIDIYYRPLDNGGDRFILPSKSE
ncbi:MAG: O-antigen ligase family protein [Bacteroidia bacterium]